MDQQSNKASPEPLGGAQDPPAAQRQAGPQPPSIGGMIRRTLAHWYVALVVLLLGVAATGLFIKTRKPAYRSETVIFYREGVKSAIIGPDGPDPLRTLSARLKETMLSRSNLQKIVEEFDLYPDVMQRRGIVDAVERLRSKIVFRTRAPDTFAISFEGATREEAQAVTQRLADLVVEENTRVRQAQAQITRDFLESKKKQAEEAIDKADGDLARFLADNPEFATEQIQPGGTQAGASVRAEQRRQAEGDPTLEALERQAPRLRTRLNPPPGGAPAAPEAPPPPPALVDAKRQADQELAAARRNLSEKQSRFTDAHPDVRTATARVAKAEEIVRRADQELAEATRPPPVPEGGDPNAVSAEAEKARLRSQLSKVEQEIAQRKKAASIAQQPNESETARQIVDLEKDWSRLSREQQRARQVLADFEAKLLRAEISASSEEGGYAAQIAVLDPAFKPSAPSSPSRSLMALAGLIASFIAGLALAAARGIVLDDRVFDAEDVERMDVAVLAVVPPAPRGRRRDRG
jgi:uncharacterized protein involved in exopolysaccharide biosynthesis